MPVMSTAERLVCTSAPWRAVAGRVVLPWVLDGVVPDGDVLEIGGGAGAMADAVLRRHPDVQLALTDLDPQMAARAERRLAVHGARASVQVADATSLPVEDGSFDLVLTFLMLHHVIAWPAALAEVARVLRPGGMLVGCDLARTRLTAGFHRSHAGLIQMATAAELEAGLRAAGFREPRVRPAFAGSIVRLRAEV